MELEVLFKEKTDALNKSIEGVKQLIENRATTEQLKEAEEKMQKSISDLMQIEGKPVGDYVKSVNEAYEKLAAEVEEIRTKGHKQEVTLEKQIENMVTANDGALVKALREKRRTDVEIDGKRLFKASDISTSSLSNAAALSALVPYIEPGVAKEPWKTNPYFTLGTKQFVGQGVGSISWYEENARTDAADYTAEGAASDNQSDVSLIRRELTFVKLDHWMEITEEAMEDSDLLMGEVMDGLNNGLLRKIESELVQDGSGTAALLSLANAATAFAKPSTLDTVTRPSYVDVLRAAALQVELGDTADSYKKGWMADIALIGPSAFANMDLEKDANGNYVLPPFRTANGMEVAGMMLVRSFDLESDEFIVLSRMIPKIYLKKAITLRTSDNVGSNFLADITTIKATARLVHKMPTILRKGIVYGDFASAISELNPA